MGKTVYGVEKEEYLIDWGYTLGTNEAEQAWEDKLELDSRVSKIAYPNRPHGRLPELPSYQSPITGKWIDGRVARRNDLASSNCVEYEPSMRAEQEKRFAREDAALDKKVDAHVEKTIYEMPTIKREKLVAELAISDVAVIRN